VSDRKPSSPGRHSRGRAAKDARVLDTAAGLSVVLEESHAIPIVDFEIILRTGSVHDPVGLEGLMRLAWLTLRKGTKRLGTAEVEEAISRLGGRLAIEVSTSYVRIHTTVIRRNLEKFLELIAHLVREPAFRASDLAQAKRETRADLIGLRDHDRALAGRWFRRTLYHGHPYGRPLMGQEKTIGKVRPEHLRRTWEQHFTAKNALFAASGDVSRDELLALVDRFFGGLPHRAAPKERVGVPKGVRGRRVVVVDKPERTQTQVYIGTLGIAAGDPRYYALSVANTAFGGTFTSKLMQEVREKRGWSYGAYSRFGADRQRDAWTMSSHPSSEQLVDCIALELDLLEGFVHGGVPRHDHAFAKKYMVNSHCFALDTAPKRLEPKIDTNIYGLPDDFYDDYEKKVKKVTLDASRAAVREILSTHDVVIALTATAKDVTPALEKLPGVRSLDVVPYDRD
jgi:zinc protease